MAVVDVGAAVKRRRVEGGAGNGGVVVDEVEVGLMVEAVQ